LGSKILLRNIITTRNHHKEDSKEIEICHKALNIRRKQKSAIKPIGFKNFAQKHNHNKEPSQGGFDSRLQDYE
jgi:hypothetical protein